MDQPHLPGKAAQKPMYRLRRECNLRDEDDRLFPAPDYLFRRTQINLCLAGAGDTMQ
jgi:hypothetical protein